MCREGKRLPRGKVSAVWESVCLEREPFLRARAPPAHGASLALLSSCLSPFPHAPTPMSLKPAVFPEKIGGRPHRRRKATLPMRYFIHSRLAIHVESVLRNGDLQHNLAEGFQQNVGANVRHQPFAFVALKLVGFVDS